MYRQLMNVYAPESKARYLALLNALSLPRFGKDKSFHEHITAMERMAAEYEHVPGRPIGDDVLLGTLTKLPSDE